MRGTVKDIPRRSLKELPGATLEVTNSNGDVYASWKTDGKPYRLEAIPAGKYTLRETAAPYGYLIANEVDFTVGEIFIRYSRVHKAIRFYKDFPGYAHNLLFRINAINSAGYRAGGYAVRFHQRQLWPYPRIDKPCLPENYFRMLCERSGIPGGVSAG